MTTESTLSHVLDLLRDQGMIDDAQRQDALVRGATQRNRIKVEKRRQAALSQGRKAGGEYQPSDAEVIASFNFPVASATGREDTVGEADVAQVIARDAGLDFMRLDPLKLDYRFVTRTLSGPYAIRHSVIPIRLEQGDLVVAIADPYEDQLIESLAQVTGRSIRPVVAPKSDIQKIASEFWGFRTSVKAAETELTTDVDLGNLEQYVKGKSTAEIDPNEKPVVQAVWFLLNYAFDQRASDIHIEPKREYSQVRIRIDGVLHDIHQLPKVVHTAVVSRIKMLGRLDIAEKRRPQDGRIKTTHQEKEIELRVSTVPVAFGEKVVLRILDPETILADLEDLGFFPKELEQLRTFISQPNGLVLVTGPTGSGKTTTLYSALKAISSPEVNVVTIEDPIEMVHEDFNQIAIQPKIDVTFGSALRTILRQDPDIIMVGEIRDAETTEQAIQAALTGHMVLSTLHTNDAAGAVSRMIDLGAMPFLLAGTLRGVVAQRLVRTVCAECKEARQLTAEEIVALRIPRPKSRTLTVFQGAGCTRCRGTGYFGRTVVSEVLEITEKIRRLIHHQGSERDIRREALVDGMLTLRDAAVRKMAEGITTYEEVIRVTSDAV